jgi:mannose-6-phosphate isomerase
VRRLQREKAAREQEIEDKLLQMIEEGRFEDLIRVIPVKKGDFFQILPGTVHAIKGGTLILETQQNSDITYRLYDYDRTDKNGQKRELHIEKALDVANLHSLAEPKQPLRVLKYRQGIAMELLTSCKYFEVYRMIVNTERRQVVHYQSDQVSFRILLCVNGCGTINCEGEAGHLKFYKGDCLFVPANSVRFSIHGQAQFLDVRG